MSIFRKAHSQPAVPVGCLAGTVLASVATALPRARGRQSRRRGAGRQTAAASRSRYQVRPVPEATLVPDLAHRDRPARSDRLQRADGERVAPAPRQGRHLGPRFRLQAPADPDRRDPRQGPTNQSITSTTRSSIAPASLGCSFPSSSWSTRRARSSKTRSSRRRFP